MFTTNLKHDPVAFLFFQDFLQIFIKKYKFKARPSSKNHFLPYFYKINTIDLLKNV